MTRNEVCAKCDSTSMEMCLLMRHCPLWVDGHNRTAEQIKAKFKQQWILSALAEVEREGK